MNFLRKTTDFSISKNQRIQKNYSLNLKPVRKESFSLGMHNRNTPRTPQRSRKPKKQIMDLCMEEAKEFTHRISPIDMDNLNTITVKDGAQLAKKMTYSTRILPDPETKSTSPWLYSVYSPK